MCIFIQETKTIKTETNDHGSYKKTNSPYIVPYAKNGKIKAFCFVHLLFFYGEGELDVGTKPKHVPVSI